MKILNGLLLLIAPSAWARLCEHDWEDVANHHVDGAPYLQAKDNTELPSLEIRPLIVNGPPGNRVDIIFFGDGCRLPGPLPFLILVRYPNAEL